MLLSGLISWLYCYILANYGQNYNKYAYGLWQNPQSGGRAKKTVLAE